MLIQDSANFPFREIHVCVFINAAKGKKDIFTLNVFTCEF